MTIAKSYNDLPVSFCSMTRLSCFKRSLFKYLISLTFFFLFSFFSVLALNVKHFAQNDLDCQIEYEKKGNPTIITYG